MWHNSFQIGWNCDEPVRKELYQRSATSCKEFNNNGCGKAFTNISPIVNRNTCNNVSVCNYNNTTTEAIWRSQPDMRFVKHLTPPDFQAKDFTPLISLDFNSFSDKKTQTTSIFGKNLHHWQKFYTAGGSDSSDKSHLCIGYKKNNSKFILKEQFCF